METKYPEVVVVGSFNLDLTFLCEEFPRPGQSLFGSLRTGPGGKGSNQAVAAARAGAETAFVGAIGLDAFGAEGKAFWRRENIRFAVTEQPGMPTGTAGIWVDRRGENQIIVAPGANEHLDPAALPEDWLAHARVVIGQLEINPSATAAALHLGKKCGAITILNPAPFRMPCDPTLLTSADLLVPNAGELAALARWLGVDSMGRLDEATLPGLPPEEIHRLCRKLDLREVIVTLGARGSLYSEPGGWHYQTACSGIVPVDTVGAGDAFVGCLAAGLVRYGGDRIESIRFANAGAALSVTRPGAAAAMPKGQEILSFLAQN